MFISVYIGLFFGFLYLCSGGVFQGRERRSTERCGRDFHTGPGTVVLPTKEINGTYLYSALADCHWNIATETPGAYILLESIYFYLETSRDCRWDYVEITEHGSHPEVHRFCGWDPVTYISASNNVTISFHSDISFEDKGFSFKFEIKDSVDDSKCNSSIYGSDPGMISSSASTCFYNIRTEKEGNVIELDLIALDFGNRSCDKENIQIFKGFSGQGNALVTLCGNASIGFVGVRESDFFIAYKGDAAYGSSGFQLRYSFVIDNFSPAPTTTLAPSLVGGDADCSGLFIDPSSGEVTYTTPSYKDNKHCIVVIRNTLFDHHLIEITFTKFEMEKSRNCMYDSLDIRTGERADSARLGGDLGKLYCNEELQGRTLTTHSSSLRLEFRTDRSLSHYGFTANIKFVPNKAERGTSTAASLNGEHFSEPIDKGPEPTFCECEDQNTVCFRNGIEKLCVPGSKCSESRCQNGGKCVRQGGVAQCFCQIGFSGPDCAIGEQTGVEIRFTTPPESRTLVRGSSHFEDCQAEVVGSDAVVNYKWTFEGEMISPFMENRDFGTESGGLLRIANFNDQMVGTYSCIASTDAGVGAEHVFEYDLTEDCPAGIEEGPKDKYKKVGESVLFPCYARTAVIVTWKKDGRLIDFDHETRFKKRKNNYLLIRQLEVKDAGIYRCDVTSSTGCQGYREAELSVLDVKGLNSYCGRTIYDDSVKSKVSGGNEAQHAEYPWHVVFRGTKSNGETTTHTFCGGSLVSQSWVLTAAHCITQFRDIFKQEFGPQSVRLHIGTSNCFGKGGIVREANQYIIHENFSKSAFMNNDIALIELSSSVKYTESIRPICIEPDTYTAKTFFKRMVYGKVAGCGDDWRPGQSKSQWLMDVELPYVDRDACKSFFQNLRSENGENYLLTDTMICAGHGIERQGDACKGDSGGALVMLEENQWVQTGIVSFGKGCDRGNYGVYTNVGKFYNWIKDITGFDKEFVDI